MAKKIIIKWDAGKQSYYAEFDGEEWYGSISSIMASARQSGYSGYKLQGPAQRAFNAGYR